MYRALTAAVFLGCILAANYATTPGVLTDDGMVPVGFGLTATAGTYLAGVTFVVRDTLQDTFGVRETVTFREKVLRTLPVVGLIVAGAALSFRVAAPNIALASGVAFLASETADLLVYSPLRSRGYVKAAVASNIVGAIVDTFLFLSIAGYGFSAVPGQLVGKLSVTLAVVGAVATLRTYRRVATA